MSRQLSKYTTEYINFLESSGRAFDTLKNCRSTFNLLSKFIGDPKIDNITLDDIMRFMRWYSQRPGRHGSCNKISVSTQMSTIKTFFKWLDQYKNIKPFEHSLIIVPVSRYSRVTYLTKDEFCMIVNSIDTGKNEGLRLRAMLETFMSTGARFSGILHLKVSDIDLERGEAIIRSKGGEYMQVYLNRRAIHWIKRYLLTRNDKCPYLWVTTLRRKEPRRLLSSSFSSQVLALKKKSPVAKDWSIHTLRHSYATHILQNGANIRIVQELLGHHSLNSTMIYTHVSNLDLKTAHKKYLKI